jgi:TolB-like protein
VLADLLDAEPSDETRKLLTEIRGPSSKRLPPRPPSTPAPSLGPGGGGVAGGAGLAKGAIARPAPRAPNGARVGILPMRSAGLPNEISYLGPGLADEIATALSRFRWLSVVASGSVARLAKGNREEPANPAAPGIDFLLDGTIQNSRNRLRFSLRLLDLRANGQVVWARRFDRQADDPLAVQDEIASAVVAQIDPAMLLIEAKRSASRAVADPSPYQLVLRSVPLITRLERDSFMRAGEFLAQAIAMEPDHAGAHLYYGYWHCLLLSQGWASDPVETRARGAELAERAVVLDPASAGAFSMAGHLRAVLLQRLDEAAVLHERALELNPNLATAWALSAVTGAFQGDTRRAEGHLARYKALAPLDPYSALFEGLSGIVHLLKRDYQAAVAAGRAVTQLNPNFATGFKPYLAALGHLAQRREAEAVLRRLLAIEPGFSVERVLDATPLERQIDRDHYAEGLRLAGAP